MRELIVGEQFRYIGLIFELGVEDDFVKFHGRTSSLTVNCPKESIAYVIEPHRIFSLLKRNINDFYPHAELYKCFRHRVSR